MQYDDSRIQYDQSNVLYDGSWALVINETASFSESIAKYISTIFSEISTITETIVKSIQTAFAEIVTVTESLGIAIGVTISETITMTEESIRFMVATTISEVITMSEVYGATFRMVISETITMTEVLTFNIYERLKGVLGMIKEFVRINDKKERVQAQAVMDGVREQLNAIEWQYDQSTLMYDQLNVCYNNYISSEKPAFILGKKSSQVSLGDQKDKPKIAKK